MQPLEEEVWEPIRVELGRLRLADHDSCFVLLHGPFDLHTSRRGHTGVLIVQEFFPPPSRHTYAFSRSCLTRFLLSKKGVCYNQATDTEQHKESTRTSRRRRLTEHRPEDENLAQARRQW
jgi:hypothetical protein